MTGRPRHSPSIHFRKSGGDGEEMRVFIVIGPNVRPKKSPFIPSNRLPPARPAGSLVREARPLPSVQTPV